MPKRINIKGGTLIVDNDIVVRRKRWHIASDGYVRDWRGKAIHRAIMQPPVGMEIDHINGNRLDNRTENLRICTHQQNLWNGRSHRDSSSKYRGVSWYKAKKRWRVQIQGKTIGFFLDEVEAANAYNAEARIRFGRFAFINVVREAGVEPARVSPSEF